MWTQSICLFIIFMKAKYFSSVNIVAWKFVLRMNKIVTFQLIAKYVSQTDQKQIWLNGNWRQW